MTRSTRAQLCARLHVMKREQGLDDDLYRDKLETLTGKRSAGELDDAQLADAVKRFGQQGYIKGASVARQACKSSALKAELAETIRQRDQANAALAEAARLAGAQATEIATLEAEAKAYAKRLETQPDRNGACTLSDDDARRLRTIR